MMLPREGVLLVALSLLCGACQSDPVELSQEELVGTWRAVLTSPGGELPFLLEFDDATVVARNGPERVPFEAQVEGEAGLTLAVEGYDSRIEITVDSSRQVMSGEWVRTRPGAQQDRLPFRATRGEERRFLPHRGSDPPTTAAPDSVAGVWAVTFVEGEKEEPARAEFEQQGSRVTGTFLTPTGDYRFLEGDYHDGRLRLSCFDGAHAFLFHATVGADGNLEGDFWSRATYHATWSGRRIDPDRESDNLPDPFALVGLTNSEGRFGFTFPDLEGKPVSLSDSRFRGRVVLVSILGSWCPNCNDEAPLLARWHQRYASQGLEVIGLAYEFTGDVKRDRLMVRRFARRHGIEFPLLLAGTSDKAAASETLPDLSAVLAYPTTIFIQRDGKVREIHSGFSGPATGEHHLRMVARMESLIEELLAEPVPGA